MITFNPITKPPFVYFGGKAAIADQVWARLGNVPNYVEPFAGGLAVLLRRPHAPRTETVNDLDCMIANFWRATKNAPGDVAKWADYPVSEIDMHARHDWLLAQLAQTDFRERMRADPNYFSARIAGWWVWGINIWIGDGWCRAPANKRPHLGRSCGTHRRICHLGDAGKGTHRPTAPDLYAYLDAIASRLRRVRVCCGDWGRVLGPCGTVQHGTTAVFLDPPYVANEQLYNESGSVAASVRDWAVANGENPLLRIALCGYDADYDMPDGWASIYWKTNGGYRNRNKGNESSAREIVWFSPHCLNPQPDIFEIRNPEPAP